MDDTSKLTPEQVLDAPRVSVTLPQQRLVLDGLRATRSKGIGKGSEFELTEQHLELIAECILQTLYNLGIASDADLDYTLRVEGSTSYRTVAKDGDVYVTPREGPSYRRRIRNDRNIFKRKAEVDPLLPLD